MISKYTKKALKLDTVKKEAQEFLAEHVELPQPVKVKKTRKERPYRFFRYRGVAFIAAKRGENSTFIQTWNEETHAPGEGIEVPREKLGVATKALAKITLAELELDGIVKK